MKKQILLALLLCGLAATATAQSNRYKIILTGASFATPGNTWFETGCEHLNAEPVNYAVGGSSIVDAAQKMHAGELYTTQDLETADVLVIMHVHDRDVYAADELRAGTRWEKYVFPMNRDDYAGAFDYVIKRYMADCYGLKDNPGSKYYGTQAGKPAMIVLCTHWHDGRTIYNASVRKLAIKWGLPLVEFDTNIGFSRQTPHPATEEQHSCLYATDRQTMDGQIHGWHPQPGKGSYIQRRMAAIFTQKLTQILP